MLIHSNHHQETLQLRNALPLQGGLQCNGPTKGFSAQEEFLMKQSSLQAAQICWKCGTCWCWGEIRAEINNILHQILTVFNALGPIWISMSFQIAGNHQWVQWFWDVTHFLPHSFQVRMTSIAMQPQNRCRRRFRGDHGPQMKSLSTAVGPKFPGRQNTEIQSIPVDGVHRVHGHPQNTNFEPAMAGRGMHEPLHKPFSGWFHDLNPFHHAYCQSISSLFWSSPRS